MRISALFPFLWTLVITITFNRTVATTAPIFRDVNDLSTTVSGISGYRCNFADGVHDLKPQLYKKKSILCRINSYFVYDTIELILPSKENNPNFQLEPLECFKNVYKDLERKEVVKLDKDLGLVNAHLKEEKKETKDHIFLTISPFNKNDVHFYCVCDNSKSVNGSTKGRVAFIEVNILKYPFDIIAVNLTNETFDFLPTPKKKADFVDKSLELTVTDGQLVVLACKQVDEHCFFRPKVGDLYRSTKVVFRDSFAIFKAPFFSFSKDVSAACTCKVDNEEYEVTVKPQSVKSKIIGCDFTNSPNSIFSVQVDLTKDLSKYAEECVINLKDGIYNTLIGLHCPGYVSPDCFFQVYADKKTVGGAGLDAFIDESEIFYIDHRLGISGLEFYELKSKDGKDVMKIFSLVGNVYKAKSFACVCRTSNKLGLMTVKLGGSIRYTISTMLLITLVVIIILV